MQLEEYSKDYLCVSLCHGVYLLRHGVFRDTAWSFIHMSLQILWESKIANTHDNTVIGAC